MSELTSRFSVPSRYISLSLLNCLHQLPDEMALTVALTGEKDPCSLTRLLNSTNQGARNNGWHCAPICTPKTFEMSTPLTQGGD